MTEQEAIETLQDIHDVAECRINHGDNRGIVYIPPEKLEAFEMGVKSLEEIQQYRAIGGTPELIAKVINFLGNDEDDSIINDLELLNQYRFLGPVEELKEAKEKQIAKKPNIEGDGYADGHLVYDTWVCPNCEKHYEVDYDDYDYCPNCGQKIDKSVFDLGMKTVEIKCDEL